MVSKRPPRTRSKRRTSPQRADRYARRTRHNRVIVLVMVVLLVLSLVATALVALATGMGGSPSDAPAEVPQAVVRGPIYPAPSVPDDQEAAWPASTALHPS